ncbi:MAG: DHH family phosphoesterase [Candidatus Helarchaeota archaeon]
MEELISYIKKEGIKKISILSHENADPDALCGIYVLKSIFNRIIPNVKIKIASDGVSNLSMHIAKRLNIEISDDLQNFSPDLIILFDVNNLNHIGKLENQIEISPQSIVIIDHHAPPPDINKFSALSIIDAGAISANEIIFYEFDQMGIRFETREALAILIGMLYDSKHFILANARSFSIVPKLIDYGANYSLAITLLDIPMVRAEKIARLKAAQRLEIFEINKWLIIFSHVSSYEASACRAILGLGADVVFVVAKQKSEIRISSRSTYEFYNVTNIHLGKDVLEKIGLTMGGFGGGHATAAGYKGKNNAENAKKEILKILKQKLSDLYKKSED